MAAGSFQLWDLATGNCVGAFDSEAAALAEVRAGVGEDGEASFDAVALLHAGQHPDDIQPIAEGRALVARARVERLPASASDYRVAGN
jgi:hypothetical protein